MGPVGEPALYAVFHCLNQGIILYPSAVGEYKKQAFVVTEKLRAAYYYCH